MHHPLWKRKNAVALDKSFSLVNAKKTIENPPGFLIVVFTKKRSLSSCVTVEHCCVADNDTHSKMDCLILLGTPLDTQEVTCGVASTNKQYEWDCVYCQVPCRKLPNQGTLLLSYWRKNQKRKMIVN